MIQNFKFDLQRFDSAFSGGNGTESDPYKISSLADLEQLRRDVNGGNTYGGKYLKVTKDITLSDNWTPIGTVASMFNGNFDGNGHIISGLKVYHTDHQLCDGFFGFVKGATIKNVHLTNVNIRSEHDDIGALIVQADETQVINCSAQGKMDVGGFGVHVGGLFGRFFSGSIKNCAFLGTFNIFEPAMEVGIIAAFSPRLEGNYYYGDYDGLNPNGATRIYNVNVPKGVTSSGIVTYVGNNYVKKGEVTFNYLGNAYKYNVTGDVTVKIDGNKLFANDTDLGATFPITLDGDGSENNPFLITSEEELRQLATYVNSGNNCAGMNFKLTRNIKLKGNFTPIGNASNLFNGTFDGDGKTISGLTTNGGSYQGLFGHVENATIKNVRLMNVNVPGESEVGALVGDTRKNTTILNCSASGNLKSNAICSYVSGVVGYINSGVTVDGCTFSGNLEGLKLPENFFLLGSHVGGIVAVNNVGATVKNCAFLGGTIKSSDGGAIISIANGSKNFIDNYYYGKLAEGIKDSGATQIFNVTLPKGVTSSSLVEINGTNYIKAGNVTLNYGGQNYSCNVNADLTVTLQDDKLYVGGEQLNPVAQLTAVTNENYALKSSADLTTLSTYATANAEKGIKLYASDKGDTLTGGAGNDSLWGGAGKDTFIYNGGNDIIYGFGNGDSLKINGFDDIIATYNAADNDIKIPCGAGSVTLKDFTTNEFAINSDSYKIIGTKLVKK